MVEMLGVLAIIGVLSIGGIQGYTMAMRKHRANEILNTMQKYAAVLYSSCQADLLNKQKEIEEGVGLHGDKHMLFCDKFIDFDKAGLGGLPSGIVAVSHIFNAPISENHNDFFPLIIRTNSGDMVRFFIHFNSQELCQTVMTTAGQPSHRMRQSRHPFHTGKAVTCRGQTAEQGGTAFFSCCAAPRCWLRGGRDSESGSPP